MHATLSCYTHTNTRHFNTVYTSLSLWNLSEPHFLCFVLNIVHVFSVHTEDFCQLLCSQSSVSTDLENNYAVKFNVNCYYFQIVVVQLYSCCKSNDGFKIICVTLYEFVLVFPNFTFHQSHPVRLRGTRACLQWFDSHLYFQTEIHRYAACVYNVFVMYKLPHVHV
jgi:hypothetical protein